MSSHYYLIFGTMESYSHQCTCEKRAGIPEPEAKMDKRKEKETEYFYYELYEFC